LPLNVSGIDHEKRLILMHWHVRNEKVSVEKQQSMRSYDAYTFEGTFAGRTGEELTGMMMYKRHKGFIESPE